MAKLVDVALIGSFFESLSDPRHMRNRKHLLVDIVSPVQYFLYFPKETGAGHPGDLSSEGGGAE